MESCSPCSPVDDKLPAPDRGHEGDRAAGGNDIFIDGDLVVDQHQDVAQVCFQRRELPDDLLFQICNAAAGCDLHASAGHTSFFF